ncbi:hypothetical protein ACHAXS_004481 [Conticribra weissflogii]
MDISIYQVYGYATLNQSYSLWLLMTLASNLSKQGCKASTEYPQKPLQNCIVESHLTEFTKTNMLTSPCQDTSRNYSRNVNTFLKEFLMIAHTQPQQSIVKPPKVPSQKTHQGIIKDRKK